MERINKKTLFQLKSISIDHTIHINIFNSIYVCMFCIFVCIQLLLHQKKHRSWVSIQVISCYTFPLGNHPLVQSIISLFNTNFKDQMNGLSYQILLALYWIIISFLTCILVPGTICSLVLIPMPDPRRLNTFLLHLPSLVVRLLTFLSLSLSLTLSFPLSRSLFGSLFPRFSNERFIHIRILVPQVWITHWIS